MARLTATFFSQALGTTTHAEIIFPFPPQQQPLGAPPVKVLYLLHGMFGGCTDWLDSTRISQYAKKENFIVVMPEVQNSFYSNMVYGGQYFTYVSQELPTYIEYMLNVKHTRANTYIAGLSMGGYGAMRIALARPDFYTAVAAFSGVLDMVHLFTELKNADDFRKKVAVSILGEDLRVPPDGDLFTLASQLANEPVKPRVLVTCGTEDFLLEGNRKFDAHMKGLDFAYTYQEWAGAHDWDFWEECLTPMFAFFNDEAAQ